MIWQELSFKNCEQIISRFYFRGVGFSVRGFPWNVSAFSISRALGGSHPLVFQDQWTEGLHPKGD